MRCNRRVAHDVQIVLRRNNLLDVYLSECKAKTVNSYHFVNTSEVKVALSPNGFFKYAHDSEQHYRCIAAAKSASRFNDQQGSDWQYVSYESHLTSPTAIHATLMRLFKHLNVALYQNASRSNASNAYADYVLEETFAFVKQDTSSQESSITNFADVVAALRNSRYESMIRHGIPSMYRVIFSAIIKQEAESFIVKLQRTNWQVTLYTVVNC
eukprot:6180083-Pleurochrysis_carterae.AAC.4